MSRKHHRSRSPSFHPVAALEPAPRLVAMSLAQELAAAVEADAQEHQDLVDAALAVGQWLADQGLPGRWDRVRPALVLACLDFLSPPERERFLFSLAGLVGHAGLLARIPAAAAQRTLDEVAALAKQEVVRVFALATSAQLGRMVRAMPSA
ncbi:MAG: hypothetical protein JXP73_09115 [Deltaproteobacteria bacterium]|nr:hypothetical protein [Deltaproteobacteria bacterium]